MSSSVYDSLAESVYPTCVSVCPFVCVCVPLCVCVCRTRASWHYVSCRVFHLYLNGLPVRRRSPLRVLGGRPRDPRVNTRQVLSGTGFVRGRSPESPGHHGWDVGPRSRGLEVRNIRSHRPDSLRQESPGLHYTPSVAHETPPRPKRKPLGGCVWHRLEEGHSPVSFRSTGSPDRSDPVVHEKPYREGGVRR